MMPKHHLAALPQLFALAALATGLGCSAGKSVPSAAEAGLSKDSGPNPDGQQPPSTTLDETTPKAGPPTSNDAGEVLFDEVLALVNADVVTRSSIRDDLTLQLGSQKRDAKDGPVEDRQALERRLVQKRVYDLLLADSINTLGIDPRRVESAVDRLTAEQLADEEREAGGALEYLERLKERGSTYESHRADMRARLRREIAMSERMRDARSASQLLVSPRELREYYETHKADFTQEPLASVELLRFAKGQDGVAERIAEARKLLASGEASATVAKKFGATLDSIDVTPDGSFDQVLRRFAFDPGQRPGVISDPLDRRDELWLLRLASRQDGGQRPFSDESVQREMRDKLSQQRTNELYFEVIQEEEQRTQCWPPDILRR